MKKTKKIYFAVLVVVFFGLLTFSSFLAQGGDEFQEVIVAMEQDASKMEVQELIAKYQDKRVRGVGYVVSVTKDLEGRTFVNLSSREDRFSPDAVNIIVFIREYIARRGLRLKIGERVRLFGVFKEIKLKTIIINEGIVR